MRETIVFSGIAEKRYGSSSWLGEGFWRIFNSPVVAEITNQVIDNVSAADDEYSALLEQLQQYVNTNSRKMPTKVARFMSSVDQSPESFASMDIRWNIDTSRIKQRISDKEKVNINTDAAFNYLFGTEWTPSQKELIKKGVIWTYNNSIVWATGVNQPLPPDTVSLAQVNLVFDILHLILVFTTLDWQRIIETEPVALTPGSSISVADCTPLVNLVSSEIRHLSLPLQIERIMNKFKEGSFVRSTDDQMAYKWVLSEAELEWTLPSMAPSATAAQMQASQLEA